MTATKITSISINEGVSEIVAILSVIGMDFERAKLDQLIQERFSLINEIERKLLLDIILLRLEKEQSAIKIL